MYVSMIHRKGDIFQESPDFETTLAGGHGRHPAPVAGWVARALRLERFAAQAATAPGSYPWQLSSLQIKYPFTCRVWG
jgi:hypothetical protein